MNDVCLIENIPHLSFRETSLVRARIDRRSIAKLLGPLQRSAG